MYAVEVAGIRFTGSFTEVQEIRKSAIAAGIFVTKISPW